jgi:catechol 2,3-dioxygenase-like lactoylglutathione lyase family enzyme
VSITLAEVEPPVEPQTSPPDAAAPGTGLGHFHVTLCVSDLDRSVRFYERLFDRPPALHHGKYARFELDRPALVLVLYATPRPPGGALSHVGLRVGTPAELAEIHERLEAAGIATQSQEGVECCYARQTKFWATDPDGALWELYYLEHDTEHSGFEDPPLPKPEVLSLASWIHRLTDPLPDRLPQSDASLDEIRLEGTFNVPLDDARRAALLAETRRVLRPGGKLVIHGLVGDRPFPGVPELPGLASVVRYVPVESEIEAAVQQAGFTSLFYETLGDVNCIRVDGVDLRHSLLSARRPAQDCQPAGQFVLYRGPFEQVRDEAGTVYRRGERVAVTAVAADALRNGPAAEQFVFLAENDNSLPMAQSCCNC